MMVPARISISVYFSCIFTIFTRSQTPVAHQQAPRNPFENNHLPTLSCCQAHVVAWTAPLDSTPSLSYNLNQGRRGDVIPMAADGNARNAGAHRR